MKACVSCEEESCIGCVHAENELDEALNPNSPQGCESDMDDDIDPDDEDNYSDDPECDYPHNDEADDLSDADYDFWTDNNHSDNYAH